MRIVLQGCIFTVHVSLLGGIRLETASRSSKSLCMGDVAVGPPRTRNPGGEDGSDSGDDKRKKPRRGKGGNTPKPKKEQSPEERTVILCAEPINSTSGSPAVDQEAEKARVKGDFNKALRGLGPQSKQYREVCEYIQTHYYIYTYTRLNIG